MSRARTQRPRTAKRFRNLAALRRATLDACRQELLAEYACAWSDELAARYVFDSKMRADHDYAIELMDRLAEVCAEIEDYRTRRAKDGAHHRPFGAKLLLRWAERHRELLTSIHTSPHRVKQKRHATSARTARQFVVTQVRFAFASVSAPPLPRELPARGLALLSLLAGNFPDFNDEELAAGRTVAEAIDRETKTMRRVLNSAWLKAAEDDHMSRFPALKRPRTPREPIALPRTKLSAKHEP